MNHAGQLHINGPFQRAVYFGGNVVTLRRVADVFQLLHGLNRRQASCHVDILPGQRDIEPLSAD
jgi:hypothetical protein